jgi:hypothetical protein
MILRRMLAKILSERYQNENFLSSQKDLKATLVRDRREKLLEFAR